MSAAWPLVRLEELATKVGSGATPKGGEASYKDAGVPLIRSMNVVFFGFKRKGLAYLDEKQAAALQNVEVRPSDVLLNITGASIGRVTIAPPEMNGARVNQHVCIIRPADGLEARFLRAFLSSPKIQAEIGSENYGVTRQALTKQQILDFEIPLAPLNEQKRIADKLDAALARVDACRERLDRVPAILKRFRQAVVAVATAGDLTADWRTNQLGDAVTNAPARGWKEQPLVNLCDRDRVITYGVIKLGKEVQDGVPCLRTSNVRWLRIDAEGMKRISPKLSSQYARTVLQGGEVLVNVRGTLGGVAVATPDMSGWNVSREVAVVPVDTAQVDSAYLALWIGSDTSQRWLSRVEKGVTYIGINIADLRNLPVEVPSMDEQQEIVRRVESLCAYADRLEARYTAARTQVDRLTPALLGKAFRGELVPQDPNDEPVSVLLERIRALRAVSEQAIGPKWRKGGGGPKASPKAEVLMLNRKDIQPTHLTTILKERGSLTAEALWSASQLDIDDFYDQLKDEEALGLLKEKRGESASAPRLLEAA